MIQQLKEQMRGPVHGAMAWVALAGMLLSSLLIFNEVLAQGDTVNEPFSAYTNSAEQPAPGAFPAGDPNMPRPEAGQMPGQPMPNPEGSMPFIPGEGQFNQPNTCPQGMVCSGRRFEDDRLKMDGERMQGMKKGLGQFVKGMAMAKNQVARLTKKGITPPAELVKALERVDEIKLKIQSAENVEALEELPEAVDEVVSVVQDWMPKLPRLAELPRVLKQAEKEMVKIERAYKLDAKKIKAKKLDLAENLDELKQAIDAQKALLAEIKALAKTDADAAFEKLDDEYFSNLDNVWEKEKVLQISLNIKTGITRMAKEIKGYDRLIKTLKQKKTDVAEMEEALAETKDKFEEVKNIYNTKPVDTEALIDAVEEMTELAQSFKDSAHEATGEDEYEPKLLGEMKEAKIEMPDAFRFEPKLEQKEVSSPEAMQ